MTREESDLSPLIGENTKDLWVKDSRKLFLNFLVMTLCFSINHATVVTLVGLASTELGDELGSIQTGVLYAIYTLSALFISAPLVQKTGGKWGIAVGLGIYCSYVGSFLIASEVPAIKWYATIVGSTLGGFAAGWLWTAQGAFFARTAQLYAAAANMEESTANANLAGYFATIFVGFEVVFKFLSSFAQKWTTVTVVYIIFTACAVGSAVGMVFVLEPPPKITPDAPATQVHFFRKLSLAVKLLARNRKMQLLFPMNVAFGFTAAMMNYWVNGTPAKIGVGKENVGYLTAITPMVATILSVPYSRITNKIGKLPMMLFGASNYAVMAFCVVGMSQDTLVNLHWGLAFLYVLGGSGRSVFEGTNKATFADFFPNDKEGAFANVIIQSGGGSAIAFFALKYLPQVPMGLVVGGMATLAMICLFFAFKLHESELRRDTLKIQS